jgi:hypothetical protein
LPKSVPQERWVRRAADRAREDGGGRQDGGTPLPVIHHVIELLFRDPGVLEGIGGVLVAELALHGGHVASLLHDVPAHGVAGGMGGAVFHVRELAGLVPDVGDDHGGEAAGALRLAGGGEEEGGTVGPVFFVLGTLLLEVVLDGFKAFPADLVAVLVAALLGGEDGAAGKVDILRVEVFEGGASDPRLDEAVDDGAVSPGAVALPGVCSGYV